jgi:hypothetical protein
MESSTAGGESGYSSRLSASEADGHRRYENDFRPFLLTSSVGEGERTFWGQCPDCDQIMSVTTFQAQ